MAASAGYAATLYTAGAGTAMTNEATTGAGSPYTVFQLTTAAKRILDPDTAVVVATQTAGIGDWNVDAAGTYSLDALFGKITFTTPKGATDLVRINSGSYLPRLAIATATAAEFIFSRASLDKTALGDTAPSKLAGLMDCAITVEMIADLQDDLDPGEGTVMFSSSLLEGYDMLLELTIGAGVWRAWVIPETAGLKGPVAGLAGAGLKFRGQQKSLTGRAEKICWSYI